MTAKGYHLRITADRNTCMLMAGNFVAKWQPTKYIFSFEQSKDGVEHMHAHLEYKNGEPPKKQSLSDYMAKPVKDLKNLTLSGKYYHKKITTTDLQNQLYCFKDLDILVHNLSSEEQEDLNDKTVEINDNKKLSPAEKCLIHIKELLPKYIKARLMTDPEDGEITKELIQTISLKDIAREIRVLYTKKYRKMPPTKNNMFQYVLYCADNLEICQEEVYEQYDSQFI